VNKRDLKEIIEEHARVSRARQLKQMKGMASPQSEQIKTRKLPIDSFRPDLLTSKGEQPLDKATQERIKVIVKNINKRIFIPLQNQGANDFKSQRRNWETSLE
jgi:hypothetical protein